MMQKFTYPRALIGSLIVFLIANAFIFSYCLERNNFDLTYLSFAIGTPLLFGVVLSSYTNSYLLIVFSLAGFISGWLTPMGFFYEKDKFTYGGFSAVKLFDFSVTSFIQSYSLILLSYFIILLISFFTVENKFPLRRYAVIPKKSLESKKESRFFKILFFFLIALFVLVNYFMFTNGIGITGIDPPRLPFRLSGILFYSSRFIFPLIIIYSFTKFKPTYLNYNIVILYACFAATTSVSRANLVLMFLPVFIAAFSYRKYIFLFFSIIVLLNFYPVVGFARNYVFDTREGVSVKNMDNSLGDVIIKTLQDYKDEGFSSGILALVERIGGGQDIALAMQYDNKVAGGSIKEFVRLYLYDLWNTASVAQGHLYDFKFEVAGYSPGDGGFFAHILLVGGRSVWKIVLLSVLLGVVLGIGNITYNNLKKTGYPREILLFHSILFTILFFVFSSPIWFNFYFVLTFFGSLLGKRISIFKKNKLI